MGELEEFAEALLDQIAVETNEEKEIANLANTIKDDSSFTIKFDGLEEISKEIFPQMAEKIKEFTTKSIPDNLSMEFPDLVEFKKIKGKKVFATEESLTFVDELFSAVAAADIKKIAGLIKKDIVKFLVYSTYAKS